MTTRADLERLLADGRVKAFLDVIARAEGTDPNGRGVGYDVIVSPGGRFTDFSRHPKKSVAVPTKAGIVYSTAAGRYQYLYSTWTSLANKYGFTGFTPREQDLGAVALMAEKGAIPLLQANNFDGAVYAVRKVWASFPGANYPGQGMRSIESLRAWYSTAVARAGGSPAPSPSPPPVGAGGTSSVGTATAVLGLSAAAVVAALLLD